MIISFYSYSDKELILVSHAIRLCKFPNKPVKVIIIIIIIIIIMQHLTRHVSVIRMTTRRRWGHVDPRVAVSVIKRFEFLFESVCSDVQVASDDVR